MRPFQTSDECCGYLSPEFFCQILQGLSGNTGALTIAAVFVCLVSTFRFWALENQGKGELLQTIAAHWKYQKQKAKKQVATICNQSDQRPTPSFSPCQHCCTWHVQNNTVLPGFGYRSPWYFPLALTRQSIPSHQYLQQNPSNLTSECHTNTSQCSIEQSSLVRNWLYMNMNCEQAKHIKHSAFCGKDRSYDFIWFICRASCGTKVHPSRWVSRIYDLDLMSHTQVCTAAELATGGHRFRVRNLHFFTDTKLSYRMIKPTVHPHDWRPDENIRPWDQWDHSKLDQCTLSKFIGQPPVTVQLHSLHSSLRWWNMMPISVLFPWLNKSVLANEAQWGSLETLWLRSSYVLISCNQNKKRNSQIEFLLKIKAIRTSFVFFLSESNVALTACRCDEILIVSVSFNSFNFPHRTPIWSGWSQRAWNENRGSRYLRWHKLTLPTFIEWCRKDGCKRLQIHNDNAEGKHNEPTAGL